MLVQPPCPVVHWILFAAITLGINNNSNNNNNNNIFLFRIFFYIHNKTKLYI